MTSNPLHFPGSPDQDGSPRVPPHSIEAETVVLGSMLLDSTCTDTLVQIIQPEHFYRPAHQSLYRVLVDMHDARNPIDLVTVREALERTGQLDAIGGVDYLVALVDGVPNAANAEYYGTIVRDKALLRALITTGTDIVRQAFDNHEDAMTLVNQAESMIFEIAQEHIGQEAEGLEGLLMKTFEQMEANRDKLITGLSSGYHMLDELTSGFQESEFIVLAARPSMGKTSCLLNIAEHMSVTDSRPLVLFSLEMSGQQIAQRLLCSHARFDLKQMRRGMISDDDLEKLKLAAGNLHQAPLLVDDSAELNVMQLRAKCRRLKATHDIQGVFVDYLQLMSYFGSASTPRQQQIAETSRGLKALARELNVPVIVAAQLNRGPEDRETHRPRMSDLRESGSIEQDADVVLLLHNEDYYHRGEVDYIPKNVTDLIVAKQRNGPTGVVHLTFFPQYTRFESAAPGHMGV